MQHIRLKSRDFVSYQPAESALIDEAADTFPDPCHESLGRVGSILAPNVSDVRLLRAVDQVHADQRRLDPFLLANLEALVEQARRITVPEVKDAHVQTRRAM